MRQRAALWWLAGTMAVIIATVVFLKTAYVVPVVMYHAIDHKDRETKLSVSPESFERQMAFLARHRYRVVPFEAVADQLGRKAPFPPRTIAITFDDGFMNNYRYAYPVLKKYNLPATIFVIVDKIGQPGYCGWQELREMASSGVITIGSHTRSHRWLPSLGTKDLERELRSSKETLERELGVPVRTLCYPIGAFNDRVQRAARAAGYRCAAGTNPGKGAPSDDPFCVKRIKISRTSDNLLVFWFETTGYYTWIKERRDE